MFLKIAMTFCIRMDFMIIWISEQIVSTSQPISDFVYSLYFLISGDATATRALIPNFYTGLLLTFFIHRMVQNLKIWDQISSARPDKHYDVMAPAFLGFVRGAFAFLTTIAALIYRLKLF
jgi:hypothetical protein